ncbi:MAG: HAMP domain-containing sensor histidine kinase [Bdellovibrionia bacterium]
MTDSAHPAPPNRTDSYLHQFICSLTHDLRSPLTAARVSAQLIKKNLVEEAKILNLIGRIITNIDRADHLIQGLLDINSLTAGHRLRVVIAYCDLASLLRESQMDFQMMHGDRCRFVSPETLIGYWSPYDLKRILENLVGNAVKYGDKDSLITIKLRDLGDQIEISVHNRGNPIPVDQQSLLFEPFQRLQSSDHLGTKGWGLGLAIVREITEAHHGSIRLESTFDTGTTFTVTLPKDCR